MDRALFSNETCFLILTLIERDRMFTFLIVYTAVALFGCAVSEDLTCIPGIF
jgi:hypothetical protein